MAEILLGALGPARVRARNSGTALFLAALVLAVAAIASGATGITNATAGTFGKTSVGASADVFAENRKRVSRYELPSPGGSVSKLSVYLAPSSTSGEQVLKGIIYADSAGAPGTLLGASEQITFKHASPAGWYDLRFSSPVKLVGDNYWVGVIAGGRSKVAESRYDSVNNSRDWNRNIYTAGPSNPFGAATVDSEQTSLYATYTELAPPPPPANTSPPAITGTPQQGQVLTEVHGSWTNEPTSYKYQWLQCSSLGEACLPIPAATGQSYVPVLGDVGHTIKVEETAANAGGSSSATSAATAVVAPATIPPPPPASTSPPAITGTPQQGQVLTEVHGSWTNEPTSYKYQWLQCSSLGEACLPIPATGQSYVPVLGDVGHTIKVEETAANAGGSSSATSAATAVVTAQSRTFGKTSVGASADVFAENRKRVSRYELPSPGGSVSKLSVYLAPSSTSGEQVLKGIIYADSAGTPGTLLGASEQITFKHASPAGWYDLRFSSPVRLAGGKYWIGVITGPSGRVAEFRFDSVSGARAWNENIYTAGPSNPFGAVTVDSEQTSLYATYTELAPPPPPANTSPPAITGTPQQGQVLTEVHGSWTNEPTSYKYQWLQCSSLGEACLPIPAATGQSYVPVLGDVGHTIKVEETAANAGGSSSATSAATNAIAGPPLGRVKYRLDAGPQWDTIVEKATVDEGWKKWLEEEISVITAYPGAFGEKWLALRTGVPVEAYRDWPNEGSPTRYAPLSPEQRSKFLSEKVEADIKAGYNGEFLDDVNWSPRYRDWEQEGHEKHLESETEPEQAEEARLVAGVREKLGQKALFEMNSQFGDVYKLMNAGNAHVAEGLVSVDIVTKEFGVGYNSGINEAPTYREFVEYVAALHAKGIQIVMAGAGNCAINTEEFEYQLASYFLVNAPASNQQAERPTGLGDYINGTEQLPTAPEKPASTAEAESGKWWKGWEVSLGEAKEAPPREAGAAGVWTREFAEGIVYVLSPGAAEATIILPSGKTWRNIRGEPITRVVLRPRKVRHGEKCEGSESAVGSGAVVVGR
jgi:hypothetical protein